MKQKVADYIADFLANNGITDVFTVVGGGAMHLNDALGHHSKLKCTYNHHEQACSIAAEAYARLTNKIAAVCVTTGPGGTNALTGVLGGWLDSIPMLIISGQVKRETMITAADVQLRQLGDQEFNIVDCVKTMTKYAEVVMNPEDIRYCLEKALHLANSGRKGPVWLDIPLDVQASIIETDELRAFKKDEEEKEPVYDEKYTESIMEKIENSKRPVILAGTGIRLAGAENEFITMAEKLNIPVVTAWNAHDIIWDEHPLYCGRPSTVGTRGGNFIVQNCDLLITLGCRLNIRQIGYNYKNFSKDSYKICVDIDKNELKKPTISPNMAINADVKDVIKSINKFEYAKENENHKKWLEWCKDINNKYPVVLDRYYNNKSPINPYVFTKELSERLKEEDYVICGNGSACVITFQSFIVKQRQRLFTNSGCASMGYGIPAALGCAVAKQSHRIICIDGDGSMQMNIQELQTIKHNNLDIKIFIINNNGYHSIRQTQRNIFKTPFIGISESNGVSFPNLEKISYAYDIPFIKISLIDELNNIEQVLNSDGPIICEVVVDENQNFEPKLSSKLLPDGTMISPEIDDMFPFIDSEEYKKIKKVKED